MHMHMTKTKKLWRAMSFAASSSKPCFLASLLAWWYAELLLDTSEAYCPRTRALLLALGFGQALDEAARARGLALAFAFDLALGPGFALGLPRAFALALAFALAFAKDFAFARGLRPGRSGGGKSRPAANHFWHSGGIVTTCGQTELQIQLHACMMYA